MKNLSLTTGRISRITPVDKGEGKEFLFLTIAVDNGKDKDGKERPADFISWDVWNQPARFVKQYLKVGDLVTVSGVNKSNSYKDKDGNPVTRQYLLAQQVEVLARKQGEKGASAPAEVASAPAAEPVSNDIDISSDDLPF